jgi:protein-disulfide isomerase-like protein with CxxC motif
VTLELEKGGVVVRVDLFVDPACMWSWLTSRWLVQVAPERGLEVRWRPYSLLLRAGPGGLEDWKAAVWGASLRAVRVLQALVAAGLPPAYAAAADDASRDEHVRRSMAEAFAVIGQGVGTPALIVYRDPPVGLLGPVVASTPTGADAVRLWDAVVAFAAVPGVLELSRPRPPRPTVPGLRWQTPQRPSEPAQDLP